MSVKHLCLLSLLAWPLSAAQPWTLPLFTADPRTVLAAASRYPVSGDLNALTFDYSVQVQIDEAGRMTKTTRTVTRILRVPAIEPAQRLAIAWIEWRENRPKIKARVITSDGRPHVLDESTIDETSPAGPNSDTPTGVKLLTAILPDVDVDSVVEVEMQQSDRETVFPGGRFEQVVIESPFAIGHFKLDVTSSSSSPLHAEARAFPNSPPLVLSESMGGAQKVTVEASNFFAGSNGTLLPPEIAPRPTVAFTDVASWQAVAQWYATIVNKVAAPETNVHATSTPDRLATVENVLENLRQKAHVNAIPFGASPYTPHTPAETLKNGSGDAKDAAVLLISRLAELGITANIALVSADPRPDVVRSVPGLEAFNRVLVYVGGEHPLWIDPSAEFTPASRLPFPDQGRWALVVDSSTADLVRTPESTASDNRQIDTLEIRLNDGTPAHLIQTLESRGVFEDPLRSLATALNSSDSDEKQNAETQLQRAAGAQSITKVDTGDPRKLLSPARLEVIAEGYAASQITDDGGFIDLPGQISNNLQRVAAALRLTNQESAAAAPARKFDYYVPPPFTEESNYHVTPPPGYQFKQVPSVASFTVGPLQFSAKAKLDSDGRLSISYTLVDPKARYTPQDVAAMRRDLTKLADKRITHLVFFNIAEAKLANGELKEGINLLRQSITSPIANPNIRLRLASAYVTAGARDAAVKICRDILAKDPNNAAAYARLGWIYTHDEFGRPFSPGMNMAEAEKAYLKAIDMEGRPAYAIELATLYTYNSAGIRFGNSARLDEALRLYNQIGLDTLARAGLLNDYAMTLLFARKYSDVRAFFLYPQADRADQAIKLAGIAASSDASVVKDEAAYAYPDAAKRRIVLIEAARYLLNSREFQPAAMLFEMAGSPPAISAADLATLRRARNFDASVASSQPAVAAFQKFIAALLNPPDPDAWKHLVVPESRGINVASFRVALLQLSNLAQQVARQPVSWPLASDLLATAVDFEAEGNDQTGFRIRAPDPTRKAGGKTVAYVVKRGNTYLVLGLFGSASESGEALARIETGDLPGARQWLAWAKDEMPAARPADPMTQPAFQRLWPPKSDDTQILKAAAASIAARGPNYEPGVKALNEIRSQITDSESQTAVDQALAQSLIEHGKYAEAIPALQRLETELPSSRIVPDLLAQALISNDRFPDAAAAIESIERSDPGSLTGMRLRERLLAEQNKFSEAAALETQICANPKASGFDWNDLAWVDLFVHADEKSMQGAADKAVELTGGRSAAVLHTLAVVQASTGRLKDARANGYELMDRSGDPDQVLTIFGRIAEQLEIRDVAADYYSRVKKPESNSALSAYRFAQMRLKEGLGEKLPM